MERELIRSITLVDQEFSDASFKSYVDHVFVKIYTAFMLDKLDSVRCFMSDEVYLEFQNRLCVLTRKNLREFFDEINVKSI